MATFLRIYEQNESNMVSMWDEVIEVTIRADGRITIQALKLADPEDGGVCRFPRSKPTNDPAEVLKACQTASQCLDLKPSDDEYRGWFSTIYGADRLFEMWERARRPRAKLPPA